MTSYPAGMHAKGESAGFEELAGGELPALQLVLGLGIYFFAAVGGLLLLSPVLVAEGVPSSFFALLSSDATAAFLFYSGFALVSILGYALLLGAFAERDFRETFRHPGIGRELAEGSLLGAALIIGGVCVLWGMGVYSGTSLQWSAGLVTGTMMGIGAACAEEVLYRGLLFRLLNGRFGSTLAFGVTSLLFGVGHIPNDGVSVAGGFSIVFTAGLLLNAAYLLGDRLWAPIGIHFAWNAMQAGVFGIDVSGNETRRGLFVGELDGPWFLTGGSMGIEGSVVVIGLGLVAGAVLTVLAIRRGEWRSFATARRQVRMAKSQ